MLSARRSLLLGAGSVLVSMLMIAALPSLGGAPRADAPGPPVAVYPLPGALTAMPKTQISFRGVIPNSGQIEVVGSSTGVHTGTVLPHSDGAGASFIPDTPFAPRETVTVQTRLNIIGASGGTFSFQIADPASRPLVWPRVTAGRVAGDVDRFNSRPDLAPAAIKIEKNDGRAAPGDFFIAPQAGPLQDGPMIRDGHGRLIWFRRIPKNQYASDFRAQRLDGKPVLTWWQGYVANGVGVGKDVILDNHYRTKAIVQAGNGLSVDLHEFLLTGRRTALVTAVYPVWWKVHGARRVMLNSIVQEIDIATGLVEFEWASLDHIPESYTYQHPTKNRRKEFDYFHVNSIQDLGPYLFISSRNTWAAYMIDKATGQITWALGGKHSSFRMGPHTHFAYQHDVRLRSPTLVTMFDDGAGPPQVHKESRLLGLRLNVKRMRARTAFIFKHSPSILSNFEGDAQRLSNGDFFVGWGQDPHFTEFNGRGQTVFDAQYVAGVWQYRAYRMRWSATPFTRPSIAASRTGRSTTVFASWNGATTVAFWRVLAGRSRKRLSPITAVRPRGFETTISIRARRFVAVVALDGRRRPLSRMSRTVRG
ncbi:MAG: aryl-sulfate sulfotransferase [Solirubrobacterales bacterium]|nr:aryl-sulfate sulfotransferase [Solirubrobacterales bacterium]